MLAQDIILHGQLHRSPVEVVGVREAAVLAVNEFPAVPSLLGFPALTSGVAPADTLDAVLLIIDQPGPLVHVPLVDEGRAV